MDERFKMNATEQYYVAKCIAKKSKVFGQYLSQTQGEFAFFTKDIYRAHLITFDDKMKYRNKYTRLIPVVITIKEKHRK